ncbi:hypothetical protein, partial [Novacetimonas hansenii]
GKSFTKNFYDFSALSRLTVQTSSKSLISAPRCGRGCENGIPRNFYTGHWRFFHGTRVMVLMQPVLAQH